MVGYIRVSLEKQANEGHSLPAQRRKVEAYAKLYDLQLVDVVVEAGGSAKSLDRPGLARALEMLRAGDADALLVVKFDRLTRSVRDLGTLIDEYFGPGKWALLSVTDQVDTRTAAGRLVLNMLASVSQWERESIGERTSAAMQHMATEGRYTGGAAPYGYRLTAAGGRLEPVEAEQVVVAAAAAARARGLTLRAIAAELDQLGHRSRVGRPFAPAQVARMVSASRADAGDVHLQVDTPAPTPAP